MTYAILSDIHAHARSLFSHTNSDGVNSRLRITLNEIRRAADTLLAQGGEIMIIAGDIFHTRGFIDPEVLNPTRKVIESILLDGISIYAIPGNHDLKSNDTSELSSAIQNLAQSSLEGTEFVVFNKRSIIKSNEAGCLGFVPWRSTLDELYEDLEELSKDPHADKMDVFIHAGIDGVLSGMPASGLTDAKLGTYCFRHVFAGHYHNHKIMNNGVVSIGATAHHNWGDVGTFAGFLTVDPAGAVTFHDTQAPKFVDLSGLDEFEMEVECKGNYVRFRGPAMSQDDIADLRKQFLGWGALGTSIEVPKAIVTARGSAPTKGLTLNESIEKFVDESKTIPAHIDRAELQKRAIERLEESRIVYEET